MANLKTPRIPLTASKPKLPILKYVAQPSKKVDQQTFSGNSQTDDPLLGTRTNSDATGSKDNPDNTPWQPPIFEGSFIDPKLAAFNRNVEAMRNTPKAGSTAVKTTAGTKTQASPVFLKPVEYERLKKQLLLADGGEAGASSGDYRYNPKTGKIEALPDKKTEQPGVPEESSDVVDIISDMPADFNFDGWDDKTARQQQNELQKAGLNPTEQFTLLNSGTSLETLAIINDISKNRSVYGLSAQDVKSISEELLKISNARIGAKNNALPLGANPITKNIFLNLLNEKEQELLASFGYGIKGIHDLKGPYSGITDQITNLLEGDNSISANLHGDSDLFEIADQYFDDMAKLDSIISVINEGKIEFKNPQEKQRYLDYLTKSYEKNDNLYRNMLASKIDEAGLLQYPEWRLKQLVSDLSITQLEGLVAQIDANGLRKLSRPGYFDRLMKELLSDTDSALSLMANETKSPICPYVWNGMDLLDKNNIQISGYYIKEDRCYYARLSCSEGDIEINLGKKLPYEVAVEVRGTSNLDIAMEQIALGFKYFATPSMLADGAYTFATYNGVPAFLPENISPSDVPYLGEFLESIDPWDHDPHLSNETITIRFVTKYLIALPKMRILYNCLRLISNLNES